ncbi:hypothetical protein VSR68_34035 [Paraburkholderia phymatum]
MVVEEIVDPWEIQCLATLAWIETTRQLQSAKDIHPSTLSSVEFDRP